MPCSKLILTARHCSLKYKSAFRSAGCAESISIIETLTALGTKSCKSAICNRRIHNSSCRMRRNTVNCKCLSMSQRRVASGAVNKAIGIPGTEIQNIVLVSYNCGAVTASLPISKSAMPFSAFICHNGTILSSVFIFNFIITWVGNPVKGLVEQVFLGIRNYYDFTSNPTDVFPPKEKDTRWVSFLSFLV